MRGHVLMSAKGNRLIAVFLAVVLAVYPLTAFAENLNLNDPGLETELTEQQENQTDPKRDESEEIEGNSEAEDGEETAAEEGGGAVPDEAWPDDGKPAAEDEGEAPKLELLMTDLLFADGVYHVSNEQTLEAALKQEGEALDIYLTEDITLSKALSLPGEKSISIQSVNDSIKTIRSAAGERHFIIDGQGLTTAMILDHVLLDGGAVGGGISVNLGNLKLDGSGSSSIQNCYVSGNGAGIWFNQGDSQVSNITLLDNKADNNGGAIAVARTSLTLNDVTIKGNQALNGGGIYYNAAATKLTVIDSEISENKAESGSQLYESDKGNGGGIYLGEGRFTMTKSTVSGNKASNRGGGIMNYTNVIDIEDSDITGNSAWEGGGLYQNAMISCAIKGGSIKNNSAKTYGGGIGMYFLYYNYIWPHIKVNEVEFSGNSLTEGNYVSVITEAVQSTHTANITNCGSEFSAFGTKDGQYFTHAYNNYDITNAGTSYKLYYEAMAAPEEAVVGVIDENEYMAGTKATVLPGLDGRAGYVFTGWSTDYLGQGDLLKADDLVTINGNTTLYGVWEKRSYTVTFDVNGINEDYEAGFPGKAVGESHKEAVNHRAVLNLADIEKPTQFGYEFMGWASKDGGRNSEVKKLDYLYGDNESIGEAWGTFYSVDDVYVTEEITGDMTLYAVWKKADFIIPDADEADVSEREPENKLRVALSSMREKIRICLKGNVYLTESMKADQLRTDGFMDVSIYSSDSAERKIQQTGIARHFHLRNEGTEAKLDLNNVKLTTSTGYGGIEVARGKLTINGNGGSAIEGNGDGKGYAYGGGIWVYDKGTLELSGLTIKNNGVPNVGRGGGIAAEGAEALTLDNVTIKDNQAAEGGGLYVSNMLHGSSNEAVGTGVVITDSTINGNKAVFIDGDDDINDALSTGMANGGGIALHNYEAGSAAQLAGITGSNVTISSNKTDGDGGGIFVNDEAYLSQIKLDEVSFDSNEGDPDRYVTVISDADRNLIDAVLPSWSLPSGYRFINPYNNQDVAFLKGIYTVTYEPNGDESIDTDPVVDENRYGEGADVTVKEVPSAFDRVGYISERTWSEDPEAGYYFAANYNADAPGAYKPEVFASGETIEEINEDLLLYAVFVPDMKKVIFNADGGRLLTSDGVKEEIIETYVQVGNTITLVGEPVYENNEKFFHHWSQDKGGNAFDFSQLVGSGDSVVILYAVWDSIPSNGILIHFHSNGGTPVSSIVLKKADLDGTINYDELWPYDVVRYGYKFAGWYTENEGGTLIQPEDNPHLLAKRDKEYNLYARWNPVVSWLAEETGEVAVSNLTTGGGDSSSAGELASGYGNELQVVVKPNPGYRVSKWIVRIGDIVDRQVKVIEGESYMIDSVEKPHYFTAYFEEDLSEVYFYDEKNAFIGKIFVPRGEAVPDVYFDKGQVPGHEEIRWYKSSDRSEGSRWKESDTVTQDRLNLYLKLIPQQYEVTFDPTIGNWTVLGESGIRKVEYRQTVTPPEAPGNNYYEFAGWVLAGTNNYFDFTTLIESPLALEAKWRPLQAPAPDVLLNEGISQVDMQVGKGSTVKTEVTFADNDAGNEVTQVDWYLTDANGNILSLLIGSKNQPLSEEEPYIYTLSHTPNTTGTYYAMAVARSKNEQYEEGYKTNRGFSEVVEINVVRKTFTIDVSAGAGGSITPNGTDGKVEAAKGSDTEFKVSANSNYKIADVVVDGESVGAVSSYTFEDVNANHSIQASFTYTGGGGGSGSGSSGGNEDKKDQEEKDKDEEPSEEGEWVPPLELETEEHLVYLHGYQDGTVRPDADINRAEVANIFYLLVAEENKEEPIHDIAFTDINPDDWYFQQVAYLQKYNIVTGYLDGHFGPESGITRAEFVTIASKFVSHREGDISFLDIDEDHWAAKYVTNVYSRGWVTGYADGTFRPDDNITRAEAVTIINKMLDRKVDAADLPERVNQFSDLHLQHWAYTQILEASIEHQYERKSSGYEVWH